MNWRALVRAGLLLAMLSNASWAQPAGSRSGKAPAVVSLTGDLANYHGYRDRDGNVYLIFMPPRDDVAMPRWPFFVGDGRMMYAQNSVDGRENAWPDSRRYEQTDANGVSYDLSEFTGTVWAPRSGRGGATFSMLQGIASLRCGVEAEPIPLSALTADETAALLRKAKFVTPVHVRRVSFAARDEDGRYFVVDQGLTGRSPRVFTGVAGKLKALPIKRVVDDTAGRLYATARGELRLNANADGTAEWRQGRKRTALIVLPVEANSHVIYRDLGLYGFLGTFCEDL